MNSWYERWAGYILSIFFHLLLVSFLVGAVRSQIVVPPPSGFEVSFDFATAAEASVAQEAQAEAVPPPEMAAATGDPEDTLQELIEELEEIAVPPEVSSPQESQPEPEPDVQEEPSPEKLLAQAEQEKREKLEKAWEQYNAIQPQSDRRASLKQAITADEVKVKGMKYLDEVTPGADTGAVRHFDMRGAPELVEEIMQRYEMRYVTRYVKESSGGYLNKASSDRGSFHAPTEAGLYEVFEIGSAGTAKLRILETEALRSRGFNPKTDRVVSITFGIVRTEHGWDLGVKDFAGEKTQF